MGLVFSKENFIFRKIDFGFCVASLIFFLTIFGSTPDIQPIWESSFAIEPWICRGCRLSPGLWDCRLSPGLSRPSLPLEMAGLHSLPRLSCKTWGRVGGCRGWGAGFASENEGFPRTKAPGRADFFYVYIRVQGSFQPPLIVFWAVLARFKPL